MRRPDERTRAQRATKQQAIAAVIADLNRGALGSTAADIRRVYLAEVRRGTGCKVVT